MNLFDIGKPYFRIDKNKIGLIEMFSGYGSQKMALDRLLGKDVYKDHKCLEWEIGAVLAYDKIHTYNKHLTFDKDLTKEQIADFLYNDFILSSNGNEPMPYSSILRLSESKIRQIYNAIKRSNNLGSITNVNIDKLQLDNSLDYILTYSFPCQDISGAGYQKGLGKETRSGLVFEVIRLLKSMTNEQKPKILLMENVPDLLSDNFKVGWHEIYNQIENLGYSNSVFFLNSQDYGVPQSRNRVFMISILGDYAYKKPKPYDLKETLNDRLEKNVDERYYLSDKMLLGMLNTNYNSYKLERTLRDRDGVASTIMARYEGAPQVVLEDTRNLKEKLVDDLIESGILYGGEVINHSFTNKNKKANSRLKLEDYIETTNRIMPTITTRPDTLGYIEKQLKDGSLRARKFTPRECLRLMDVRDDDIDKILSVVSDSQAYKLAGNSIVVNVLVEIFKNII